MQQIKLLLLFLLNIKKYSIKKKKNEKIKIYNFLFSLNETKIKFIDFQFTPIKNERKISNNKFNKQRKLKR